MTKTKKKAVKVMKVQIEEPVVEAAPETFKIEPKVEEPTPVEKPKVEEPKVDPNLPELVGISEGLKRPSITDLVPAHTRKQYKALIEAYKISNPAKYEGKKVELAAKLKRCK